MAAVNAVSVPTTIFFNDSFAPCVVTPGTWDMKGVTWQANWGTRSDVEVQEGAIFTQFRSVGTDLSITFSGTTPPVADFVAGGPSIVDLDLFYLGLRSQIITSGAGPFFKMSQGGTPAFIALDSSSLMTGTVPTVLVDAGTIAGVAGLSGSQLEDNTLSGPLGSIISVILVAPSAGASFIQPAMLGSLSLNNICFPRANPTALQVGPLTTTASDNDLMLCDLTNGDVNVNFLPAKLSQGLSITVKNQSSNAINSIIITPSGSDTIDGSPTGTITGSRAAATYVSDGISDWVLV